MGQVRFVLRVFRLGVRDAYEMPGTVDSAREAVMAAVRAAFRPEFLNRLDEIVLFHRLSRGQMNAIVEIQLGRLRKLLDGRDMDITLDDGAVDWLAEAGYDPVYGARPLKRVIQRHLQDPLATMILSGAIADGARIQVGVSDGGLTVNGEQLAAA